MTDSTPIWVVAFLAFYFVISGALFFYGMHAYLMVWLYRRARHRAPAPPEATRLPRVTVQLPLYNERYVAARLLEAVSRLEYPRHLLEIQVLDDSTDETWARVAAIVDRLRAQGWNAVHLRRDRRIGYKGGALREGLASASGELVAVFDADFLPPPRFLQDTVGYFADPRIGMVQTRWTHLNEAYSPLTRAQAAALDGHFLIEHTVRNRQGAFINFNGTAGIWRRTCILEAGNWQDDTLTEDLDLSYRAQLAGWKFLFLPQVECPAELPAEVNGFKRQQFRWTKGSVQTARKLLPRVLSARIAGFTRFQALVHLTNHAAYPLLLLLGVCSFPALWILDHHPETGWLFRVATILILGSCGHPWLYWVSQRARGKSRREACWLVPLVVAGNMGVAINNTRALLEGLLNRPSEFERTPKYDLRCGTDGWRDKTYRVPGGVWPAFELLFAAYTLVALGYALGHGHFWAAPFLALYVLGAGTLGGLSLRSALETWGRPARSAQAIPAAGALE